MAEKLSRRAFLETAALIAGSGLVTWFGLDQLFTEGLSRQILEDWYYDQKETNVPEFEQQFSLEKCSNKGRAFMIVHKGFLSKQGHVDGGYGSYSDYLNNINKLEQYLQRSKEPTILAVENRVYNSGNFREDSFLPTCSAIVVTKNHMGEVKKYIFPEGELHKQNLSKIITYMQNSGITKLCCAGEMAWKGSGLGFGTNGCLGELAENFAQYFDIKGIDGCVYPLHPPKQPNETLHELFSDTIPIPQL